MKKIHNVQKPRNLVPAITAAVLVAVLAIEVAYPAHADDAFSGWDEDTKEDARDTYDMTDWESIADYLIYDESNIEGMHASVHDQVRNLEDLVKDVINSTAAQSDGIKERRSAYVEIMLAMIEVLSNGNPSSDDPCNIRIYFDPDMENIDAESSIRYLFNRLISSQNAYDNTHSDRASVKNVNDAFGVMIEGVMLGNGYSRITSRTAYSYDDANLYYNSVKDTFDTKGIVPIINFADLVRQHYSTTIVNLGSSSSQAVVESSKMQEVANNARNGNSNMIGSSSASWVNGVYEVSGVGNPGCTAIDYWNRWRTSGSTSTTNIPVGATVICSGSSDVRNSNDSDFETMYGRVGIYIGNGTVAEYINGASRTISLSQWIQNAENASSMESMSGGHHGYIGWVWPFGQPIS